MLPPSLSQRIPVHFIKSEKTFKGSNSPWLFAHPRDPLSGTRAPCRFQITSEAGCSGFVTAKPSSVATRQSFWSAATKTVASPARLRPRATASCSASRVRNATVTPYLKSRSLALRKCSSLTAATKRRPRPRSASRRRRAITAACWSISPVLVFNAKTDSISTIARREIKCWEPRSE